MLFVDALCHSARCILSTSLSLLPPDVFQSVTPGVLTLESRETPLHKAVKRNHRRVAQLLIQNGECVLVHLCQPQ